MIAILALPIVIGAGYFIAKKYNTSAVLFGAGLLMMLIGAVAGNTDFLPKGVKTSGAEVVDFFLVIQSISSSTLANLGLIIMSVGGFSKYMNHIGAANALVKTAIHPLSYIRNPYIVLAMAYLLGQFLNVFIPSAVGLAMLLLVALYPVLVGVGCTPSSVAAVLATTACLDLGPASGASNKAAEVIGIDAASYFVEHQLVVGIVSALVIAVLHFFSQRYFDRKDAEKGVDSTLQTKELDVREAPIWFAVLPILPLVLLLTFSSFAITSIKIDVVTAMFISLAVAMLCDFIYSKNAREVAASLKVYLQGMGDVFASVVSLIIAAQTFVVGLTAIGFISSMLAVSSHLGFGYLAMVLLLVGIIGVTTLMSGSGNAAFFSFSNLAPDVATQLGTTTAAFIIPMQLSAGIFRSFSPVSGVVIACAAVANVTPLELVKRTAIPMLGGILSILIVVYLGV